MRISDWSSDVCSSDLQDRDGGSRKAPDLGDTRTRRQIPNDRRFDSLYRRCSAQDCLGEVLQQWPNLHRTRPHLRSEEHTSELQSLMRISYAVFCLKKKRNKKPLKYNREHTIQYKKLCYI